MNGTDPLDVLIIGAGPSGATLALLLAKYGVKVMAVSRHHTTANTPRAHIFNQRAMEVLRDAGLERRVSQVASLSSDMQNSTWSHSLAGEEYGRMWSWGNKPSEKHRYEMASPCVMSDLPQSYLEPILVDAAGEHGATVKFGVEFVSLEDNGDSVTTCLRDRTSGEEFEVQSKYLIGADGARSAVIDALGIPIDGKQLNSAFNVHIKADLSKYLAHRPANLNWIFQPDSPEWSAVGAIRMVRAWNEFIVSMHPAQKHSNNFEPSTKQIIERLHQMIGDNDVEIELLSTFRWTINDQVARTWQKGKVLCIGDAVHRHPPTNGLGSNTCISDAMNLAWKLAFVLQGKAGPALLDSLTIERKPVGVGVVRRANEGIGMHRKIGEILGMTPEARQNALRLLESATAEGREERQKLRAAFDATDLEFQALGIQMNQIYVESSATLAGANDKAPSLDGYDLLKEVVVSTYPGFHLPHVWLAASGQSPRVSTLDLCGHGSFTVVTGIGGECWHQATKTLRELGVPIRSVSIGFHCDYMDCYGDWQRVREVDEDGLILVRPDHFVGWRYPTAADDATQLLRNALSHTLAKFT